MKRYRFALETLLRVRRAEESAARQSLARANVRVCDAASRRNDARQRYETMVREEILGTTPAALASERIRLSLVAEVLSQADATLDVAMAARHDAERTWSSAAERVSVLERLEEKGRAEHRALARRREVASADERAAERVARAIAAGTRGAPTEEPSWV